jgi:hypothetical protein
MSKDKDPQQRLWLSLGYGGKRASTVTWRYWAKRGEKGTWIIAAPNDLAKFEQRGREVFLNSKQILSGRTQWHATWAALAYFYSDVVPTIEPPRLGK